MQSTVRRFEFLVMSAQTNFKTNFCQKNVNFICNIVKNLPFKLFATHCNFTSWRFMVLYMSGYKTNFCPKKCCLSQMFLKTSFAFRIFKLFFNIKETLIISNIFNVGWSIKFYQRMTATLPLKSVWIIHFTTCLGKKIIVYNPKSQSIFV